MRGSLRDRSILARIAGAAGLGALVFTAACGASQNAPVVPGQAAAVQQPSPPVVVSCEPNQRTLVRPVMVNGVAMSQVECVSTDDAAVAQTAAAQAAPVSYYRAPAVRNTGLSDTRYVPASSGKKGALIGAAIGGGGAAIWDQLTRRK